MKAARMLKAAIEGGTNCRRSEPITDEFAQAVARRLENRGIATVDGLPEEAAQAEWYDLAIELANRNRAVEAAQAARRKAEEGAQSAPQSTAGILAAVIHGQAGGVIPLNGAGVLRAALADGQGTINGDS